MKRFGVFALACALIASLSSTPARALDPVHVAPTFDRITASKFLANPSVMIIDQSTGEVVYQRNATSQRKPASVLKLISTASALRYLNPEGAFMTNVYVGTKPRSIVIQGSLDPWICEDDVVAGKMGRTSLPRIAFNSLSALKASTPGTLRSMDVYYSNLYAGDVNNLKAFWAKRGITARMKEVSADQALNLSGEFVLDSISPDLATIIDWTLTWSDNQLADRIAKLASMAAGNGASDEGVYKTFKEVLTELGIDASKLITVDGSGLSKSNRVTAQMIAQLLVKVRNDPRYAEILDGLPVGGQTGTLRHRFLETAPEAVGLVKAKTGTLNGTMSLAGYVQSEDREYAFVVIADQIPRGYAALERARNTVDRLLGKIAKPIVVVPTPAPSPEATPATS